MTSQEDKPALSKRSRLRAVAIWTAIVLAIALACRTAPIFAVVDIDLAIVFAFLSAIAAGSLAVAEARRAPDASPILSWLTASFLAWPVLLTPAAVVAILPPRCNDATGWAFFALLPLVTTFVAAAIGLVAGRLFTGRFAYAVVPLALVASVIYEALTFASSGIMVAYSPLWGFFPGSIYDEVALVNRGLIAYRFICLFYALLPVASFELLWLWRRRNHEADTARWVTAIGLAILSTGIVFGGNAAGRELGFGLDRANIARELDGTFESEHFVYHFPKHSWIDDEIHTIAEDHEFRFQQNADFLGITPDHRIQSYLYLSPEQKKRLTGAGNTVYADIPHGAIHLNASGFPQRSLGHELLHVMTEPFSLPVVRVSWKMALIEGIATASEGHRGDLTIHQWAKAMRDLGKAPELSSIMGPVGFWRQQASRSYLLAGSFVLYLRDEFGTEKLRAVYARGDFVDVYGKTRADLEAGWLARLETVTVSDRERKIAEHRFARRAIFDRPCARYVARERGKGRRALANDRPHIAIGHYRNASVRQPGNMRIVAELVTAYTLAGNLDRAASFARAIQSQPTSTTRQKNDARLQAADLAWRMGNKEEAMSLWQQVANGSSASSLIRRAAFRLAITDSAHAELLAAVVDPYSPKTSSTYRFAATSPGDALTWYLLGRWESRNRKWTDAADSMDRALWADTPEPVRIETLRLLGIALYITDDLAGAIEAFEKMKQLDLTTGGRLFAEEMIARCRWAQSYRSPASD